MGIAHHAHGVSGHTSSMKMPSIPSQIHAMPLSDVKKFFPNVYEKEKKYRQRLKAQGKKTTKKKTTKKSSNNKMIKSMLIG